MGDDDAITLLRRQCWSEGEEVICPHCCMARRRDFRLAHKTWRCAGCDEDFSVPQPLSTLVPLSVANPAAALIEKIRDALRALLDGRKQRNARRDEMEDAALSAFAVPFSQGRSLLDSHGNCMNATVVDPRE